MLTHISGVKKVSHAPGVSGSTAARFGVKTDQEELLSKVRGGGACEHLARRDWLRG